MEERFNFRVVGRTAGGTLYKAHSSKGFTKPSIPSKLETVLVPGDREQRGFGSNALRFPPALDTDSPGPARYSTVSDIAREIYCKPSWSERGTGSFASKSRRFRRAAAAPGPGPAVYDVSKSPPPRSNPAAPGFAPRTGGSPGVEPVEQPGPGAYSPSLMDKRGNLAGVQFQSRDPRSRLRADQKPGPGAYDPGESRGADGLGPSRFFSQPSPKRIGPVHPDLPVSESLLFFDDKREFLKEIAPVMHQRPGPGAYNADVSLAAAKGQADFSTRFSSMFMRARSEGALKPAENRPGPGFYNPPISTSKPKVVAVASFKSEVDRQMLAAPKAPGPAFYSPKPAAVKSFHLNIRGEDGKGKWV
mmetsp:Transcript_87157/g.233400  ORF Transcript_87157/g.233400 Transcript_87157/m.233400 type:complete len:360 (-) Transcript_87157:49-1128(-)